MASRAALRTAQQAQVLREFLASSDRADRAQAPPARLAAAARAQLKFAAQRRRGQALVRVFNPTLREHGFDSVHTVIQIVTDDMPFLVDSVGLALTRRGSAVHLLAHPVYAVQRDRAGRLRGHGWRATNGA